MKLRIIHCLSFISSVTVTISGMFRQYIVLNSDLSELQLFGKPLATYEYLQSYIVCAMYCIETSSCSTGRFWIEDRICTLYAPAGDTNETTPAYISGSRTFILAYVSCPIWLGYVYDDKCGLCIKMVTSSPTMWKQAAESCADDRAQLAKIDSQLKQDFIESLILAVAPVRPYYIGLNDQKSEGNFVWTDGTQKKYDHFELSNPNGMGNCVKVRRVDQFWGDFSCSRNFAFISEVKYL